MKRKFKVFSLLLVCVLLAQQYVPVAHAATPLTESGLVLLDKYSTDHYDMVAYKEDNMFYVITAGNDGSIELAFAEQGNQARSLWLDATDIANKNNLEISSSAVDKVDFARSIIEYGMQHQNESKAVEVEVIHRTSHEGNNAQARGTGTDDYNSLIDQLEAIHGPEHFDYNWTGMVANIVGGLTFNYKQMLDYDMIYRDSFAFNVGTTLGGLVATILAFIPGMAVPMAVLAGVLGVAALTNTILEHSGSIASYYGSAVYCRYVMVEGGGPYFECYKTTDYNGWVEEGNYYSATLEELGTRYTFTKEIFDSYVLQRERARENYE